MSEKRVHKTSTGRTPTPPEDLRTKAVKVRYSATEYEKVRNKAFLASLSVADYIRRQSIEKEIIAPMSVENVRFLREWAKVSNNLNQLAKLLHTEGILKHAQRIENFIKFGDKLIENERNTQSGTTQSD